MSLYFVELSVYKEHGLNKTTAVPGIGKSIKIAIIIMPLFFLITTRYYVSPGVQFGTTTIGESIHHQ